MADIEVVIKISEEDYKYIKNSDDMNFNVIKNGTPLSKGHGDLYDCNDLSKLVGEDFQVFLSRLDLNLPQPIIKADKEGRRMSVKEIIDGLKFTVDMFLLDPITGETFTEPRNDLDKTTIDACKGAIELIEQTRWIPVSEGLPDIDEEVLVDDGSDVFVAWWVNDGIDAGWHSFDESYNPDRPILAWKPLPEPYKAESEE